MKAHLSLKDNYIGGLLCYQHSNIKYTTMIIDLVIKESSGIVCLTIIGNDFIYGFELSNISFERNDNYLIIKDKKRESIMCLITPKILEE